MPKILAIIPARGGSKGIPHKNVRGLRNHPLLAYSIAVAKLSKYINRIIISTDDLKIATVAKRYQAEVPFLRPKEFAKDESLDIEFMTHALNFLKKSESYVPDLVIHLRPTTPLRRPEPIDEAIEKMLANKDATSLVSGHDHEYTAYKLFKLNKDYINYFGKEDFEDDEEYYNYPRQSLPKTYLANGYVDILLPNIITTGSMYGKNMLAFITEKTADIDTIEDFYFAEKLAGKKIYTKLFNKVNELKLNKVGIMQGRLLPPVDNRIQAFPADSWEEEFRLAKDLGLDCIEMIFEVPNMHKNPLFSPEGVLKLKQIISETGVNVFSVCADYFMHKKLFGETVNDLEANLSVLDQLIDYCSKLDIHTIVIPCVDESELKNNNDINELVSTLTKVQPKLEKTGIKLALETSLPPQKFKQMIDLINHKNITVNYNSGNSASLGYSPKEEFKLLGRNISHIHIKDRIKNGGTVLLGSGDTDFESIFKQIRMVGYSGTFIIQGARNGDERKTVSKYIKFLDHYF